MITKLLLPVLLLMQCGDVNAQEWRQIVPLQSTRADVERRLGRTNDGYLATYLLKEGTLSIVYSSGPCRADRKDAWNVAENVVLIVSFAPRDKRRIADLKLDPRKFRKVSDQHVIGILYYINDEDGITYEVQDGKIDSIEYGPAKRDQHLACERSGLAHQ